MKHTNIIIDAECKKQEEMLFGGWTDLCSTE